MIVRPDIPLSTSAAGDSTQEETSSKSRRVNEFEPEHLLGVPANDPSVAPVIVSAEVLPEPAHEAMTAAEYAVVIEGFRLMHRIQAEKKRPTPAEYAAIDQARRSWRGIMGELAP